MVIMDVRGDFLVKKRPFKQYLGKTVKYSSQKNQKQGQVGASVLEEPASCLKSQLVKLAQNERKTQLFETNFDPEK